MNFFTNDVNEANKKVYSTKYVDQQKKSSKVFKPVRQQEMSKKQQKTKEKVSGRRKTKSVVPPLSKKDKNDLYHKFSLKRKLKSFRFKTKSTKTKAK